MRVITILMLCIVLFNNITVVALIEAILTDCDRDANANVTQLLIG